MADREGADNWLWKHKSLRSQEDPEDNDVNKMTQRSIDNENPSTSSHHDNINTQAPGNRENQQRRISNELRFQEGIIDNNVHEMPQFITAENVAVSYHHENTNCQNPRTQEVEQSNTSRERERYHWNLMAAADKSDNWMWIYLKLDNFNVQCNVNNCDETYAINKKHPKRTMDMIKGHLYHAHNKWNEGDSLKWESDNNLMWRYYDKVGLYKERCKFCENMYLQSYIPKLRTHLQTKHSEEIRTDIQKDIADKSLSQNYEIHEEKFSARCKRCNIKMDIFYGADALMNHICIEKIQSLRSREEPEDNDVNRMMQQSIDAENTSTSSNHDNINTQAPGNRENQESNTSRERERYYWNLIAAADGSDNWMWVHLKLDKFNVQCNVNNCDKTYANGRNIKRTMALIKGHLYHTHNKWDEEDSLKWESDNHLIWRHFDKVGLYKGRCHFCEKIYHHSYIPKLRTHLQTKHSEEIRTDIQKEIADKSLSQNYEIHEEKFSARCKHCNIKIDIFYGADALINHICIEKVQSLRSREGPEDNDMNRMPQQPLTDENPSTSSNHDNINTQVPGNRENQESSEGNNMDGNGMEQFLLHDDLDICFRHDCSISELLDIE